MRRALVSVAALAIAIALIGLVPAHAVSSTLVINAFGVEYDPVHVNGEFVDQASDHDPQVARLDLRGSG